MPSTALPARDFEEYVIQCVDMARYRQLSAEYSRSGIRLLKERRQGLLQFSLDFADVLTRLIADGALFPSLKSQSAQSRFYCIERSLQQSGRSKRRSGCVLRRHRFGGRLRDADGDRRKECRDYKN